MAIKSSPSPRCVSNTVYGPSEHDYMKETIFTLYDGVTLVMACARCGDTFQQVIIPGNNAKTASAAATAKPLTTVTQ